MHEAQKMVREFYLKLGSPVSPAPPMLRDAMLRARLLVEEAMETAAALVGTTAALNIAQDFMGVERAKGDRSPDIVEAVDGVCDTLYVAYGAAEAMGVDIAPYFAAVHHANMSKENRPVDAHGKRGYKPEGWVDPKVHIAQMLGSDSEEWAYRMEWRYRR